MKNIFILIAILASALLTVSATAEIIKTNEFWICDGTNTANLGTPDNPYDGSTQSKFDAIMKGIPQYCTIHILAGTYQTWGSDVWGVKSGQKIFGSGIDVTILQFAPTTPAFGNGPAVITSFSCVSNVEISDLTCDCNFPHGRCSYHGIVVRGTENVIRRVKMIHNGEGNAKHPAEVWGIDLCNNCLPSSTGNIIEDCEVSEYSGGHGMSAIALMAGSGGHSISGIVRNNRVFLKTDPHGAFIGYNLGWATDSRFESNYVDGADSGLVTDTGGATNIIFAHNFFKNVYAGFVFWNYPRRNLTFAFNKILLCPTNSYFSTAFGFPDGTFHTNITIIGNDVGWDGIPARTAWFLYVTNIVGLTVADNIVDSSLKNHFSANGLHMYNNYDQHGNYLSGLNIPAIGGKAVTSKTRP